MSGYVETFRGVVYPQHCDHQNHLTTMHYVGFFDQASWQLISMIGLTQERLRRENRGFVDVRQCADYMAEQPVGSPLLIESGIARIGNSSFVHIHRMTNIETGVTAATSENVSVFFDLEARVKMDIGDELRESMKRFTVERDG
jgi:acyl-CoA thioester hydrolase